MSEKFTSINELLLFRISTMCKGMNAEYCVKMPDGTVHGSLKVAAPEPEVTKWTPRVNFVAHYLPYVGEQSVGAVTEVPFINGVKAGSLSSAVSAWCVTHWGAGNVVTHINYDKNCVEVMRVG